MASALKPASNGLIVTPSDTINLPHESIYLYVGVAGDVSVEMKGVGTALIIDSVPAGTLLPIKITRVNSTGTAATDMVVFY